MPDDHPTDHEQLDELASAALDHEATDAEARLVASDPALGARVERFRAVTDQLAQVDPLEDAVRESLLANAVGAALVDGELDPSAPTDELGAAPPASLAERRARRRWLVPAVAAAIIVILAVPALLVGLNRDSGVHDLAVSTSADQDSALDEGARAPLEAVPTTAAPSSSSTDGASARESTTPAVALGSAANPDELSTSVENQLTALQSAPGSDGPTTTTSVAAAPSTTGSCEDELREARPDLGALVLHGSIVYQGIQREVYGFEDVTGAVAALVTDETCGVVTEASVPPG